MMHQAVMRPLRYMIAAILASTCVLLHAVPSHALVEGTRWRGFSEGEKKAYVVGILDSWNYILGMVSMANPGKKRNEWKMSVAEQVIADVVFCGRERMWRYDQIFAIVEKYMTDNPDQWNYAMASIVWTAINEVCRKGQ